MNTQLAGIGIISPCLNPMVSEVVWFMPARPIKPHKRPRCWPDSQKIPRHLPV